MAGEQGNYQDYMPDPNMKIRDLEEKQRYLKNQLLLVGRNLIDIKEKSMRDVIEIKKEIENMKDDMERVNSLLSIVSEEFQKLARKDDVELLAKQLRMLRPSAKI